MRTSLPIAIALLQVLFATRGYGQEPAAKVTFEEHVRPILKAHCFYCHGEDGETESNLDVRLRKWIVKGGDSGPAVLPGNPGGSLLLERVRAGEMPPGEKRLSDNDVATIERWIADGAPTLQAEPDALDDEPHFTVTEKAWWSFQPVRRPKLSWEPIRPMRPTGATAIDTLILAKMDEHGTAKFAPTADRRLLIRRLYLDMLGVPPTPNEVAEFVADQRPAAWERLVDRVLSSPKYGERWGRHWLDVAGYADSDGYTEKDTVRDHAYHYRDYVIQAFNAGKPYDEFVREQLAGDEISGWPNAKLTPEVVRLLAATGFLRTAPDGTSGSADQPLARNQVMADTLQIVGVSLMAMTMHCAQCHDHRYDPIPQADYYRMRAIFEPALNWKNWRSSASRRVSLYTPEDVARRDEIEAKAKRVDAARKDRVDFYIAQTLEHELLMLDEPLRGPLRTAYQTPAPKRTDEQKKLLESHVNVANITAGSLYLYDRRREARAQALDERRIEIAEKEAARIRDQALSSLDPNLRKQLVAALDLAEENRSDDQRELLKLHPLASATGASIAKLESEVADELKVYETAAADIRKYRIATELKKLADDAAAIRETIPTERFVRPLTEPTSDPPPTFVFHRGDHQQPRKQVSPAGLSILGLDFDSDGGTDGNSPNADSPIVDSPTKTSSQTTGRRLAFANHLTRKDHPLVSRAFANRIWLHHFGRGLAGTPGDFGRLGQAPTHPELLDYLASELLDSQWDVKHLHRQILTSQVYQLSVDTDSDTVARDPENRWYGRWTARRLEAEVVRDSMLAVSGQLNSMMFGEPVPVMEDGVGQIVLGKENLDGERKPTKPIPLGGQEFRRSVYVQVRRSRPLSVLETFDLAETAPHCPKRASSNVTPQALVLMNSRFSLATAKLFASRLQSESDDLSAQVQQGWELVYGRPPSESQRDSSVQFVKAQQATVKDPNLALATFCQALFSSSRFLYIE